MLGMYSESADILFMDTYIVKGIVNIVARRSSFISFSFKVTL